MCHYNLRVLRDVHVNFGGFLLKIMSAVKVEGLRGSLFTRQSPTSSQNLRSAWVMICPSAAELGRALV